MLLRPLVQRELLRESRRRRHFVERLLLVAVLVALAALFRPRHGVWTVETAQDVLARYGTTLFLVWLLTQHFAVNLFSISRAAALADERRKGSLQLARITSLGNGGVILGWFASVMGRAVFTMLLALPVLVVNRAFGGFTIEQVVHACVVALTTAMAAAALTLNLASRSRTAVLTIALSILAQAGALLCFYALANWTGGSLGFFSAGYMLERIGSGGAPGANELASFAAVRVLLSLAFLARAAFNLERPVLDLGPMLKRSLNRVDRYFLDLSRNRQILWRSELGGCRGNPVLWRERSVSAFGRHDNMIRLFYWPLGILLVVTAILLPFGSPHFVLQVTMTGLIFIPLAVFSVMLIVTSASAFPRERQKGALELLAATPLSAGEILMGKFGATCRLAMVPAAFALLLAGLWACFDVPAAVQVLLYALMVFALIPLVAAQALYVGAAAGSSGKAIMSGAALLAGCVWLWACHVSDAPHPIEFVPWLGRGRSDTARILLVACVFAVFLTTSWILYGRKTGFAISGVATLCVGIGLAFRSLEPVIMLSLAALAAAVFSHKHRGKLAVMFVFGGLVVLAGLREDLWRDHWEQYYPTVTAVCLLPAAWFMLRHAGSSIVWRSSLAFALPWFFFAVMPGVESHRYRNFSFGPGELGTIELRAALFVTVCVFPTLLLLRATALQLDRLMGRNDAER